MLGEKENIETKDVHEDAIRVLIENERNSACAFHESARMMQNSRKKLWDYIKKRYPKIEDKKCCLKFDDGQPMRIVILE